MIPQPFALHTAGVGGRLSFLELSRRRPTFSRPPSPFRPFSRDILGCAAHCSRFDSAERRAGRVDGHLCSVSSAAGATSANLSRGVSRERGELGFKFGGAFMEIGVVELIGIGKFEKLLDFDDNDICLNFLLLLKMRISR